MKLMSGEAWKRRGISLLWDGAALARCARPAEVISIRQFFAMAGAWPDELPSSDGRALVVAGVEGALDALSAEDAERWVTEDLKPAILEYGTRFESVNAALLLWLPAGRARLRFASAGNDWHWRCGAHQGAPEIELGRLLWSGAQDDVNRILVSNDASPDPDGNAWVGLYHPRIS